MLGFSAWIVASVIAAITVGSSDAMTLTAPDPAELARGADAVVRVRAMAAVPVRRGDSLVTLHLFRVVQVWAGDVEGEYLEVELPGGESGGWAEVFPAVPHPAPGREWVVFVRAEPDGRLRPADPVVGLLPVSAGGVVTLPRPVFFAGGSRMPAAALRDRVVRTGVRGYRVRGVPSSLRALESSEQRPAFSFVGGGRFFEPDLGGTVSFLIDERGDALLGFEASLRALQDAFRVWSEQQDSRLRLEADGTTSDLRTPCGGPSKVLFGDPDDLIPPPVHCSGTLALGSFCTLTEERKVVAGSVFGRAIRARLVFADGWEHCAVWTECNLAEIATHELGHAVGLGHSPDPEAAMFSRPHFGGRCAALGESDAEAVSALYPDPPPPTVLGPSRLPDAVRNSPWEHRLVAVGGGEPLRWRLESGSGCVPPAGLLIDDTGRLFGTVTEAGIACVRVRVEDGRGMAHVRAFSLAIRTEDGEIPSPTVTHTPTFTPAPSPHPSPTTTMWPTVSPTRQPTPTPSVTPPHTSTPTKTPAPCVGDCSGDGTVSVSELVLLVAMAVEGDGLEKCPAGDCDGDGVLDVADLVRAVQNALSSCDRAGRDEALQLARE